MLKYVFLGVRLQQFGKALEVEKIYFSQRIVLGICLERFSVVNRPLLSVREKSFSGTLLFIGGVLIGTFLLTFYTHIRWAQSLSKQHKTLNKPSSYRCITRIFCGTQLYVFCLSIYNKQFGFTQRIPPITFPLKMVEVFTVKRPTNSLGCTPRICAAQSNGACHFCSFPAHTGHCFLQHCFTVVSSQTV